MPVNELKSVSKISDTFGIELDIPDNGYDDNFQELHSSFLYNMEQKFIYSATLFPINEDKDDNIDYIDDDEPNYNKNSKKWNKTIDGELWRNEQLNKIEHLLSINTNNIDNSLDEMTSDAAISLLSFSDFAALNTIPLSQYLALHKGQKKKKKRGKKGKKSDKFHPKPQIHFLKIHHYYQNIQ